MKLQLNKLMAGLVLAGSVVALVGCGGGDAPTLTVTGNAKASITPATLASTKVIVGAAENLNFNLPNAVTFPNRSTTGTPASTPPNTVLTIDEKPDATGNEIGTFSMSAGPNDKMDGVLETGSCNFKVTSITGTAYALLGWKIGDTYKVDPCAFNIATQGTAVGTTVDLPLTITLGTATFTGNATVEVTIEPGENNNAEVIVGDTPVADTPLPTGAPPA